MERLTFIKATRGGRHSGPGETEARVSLQTVSSCLSEAREWEALRHHGCSMASHGRETRGFIRPFKGVFLRSLEVPSACLLIKRSEPATPLKLIQIVFVHCLF